MRVTLTNEQTGLSFDEGRFVQEVTTLATEAGLRGELSVAVITDDAIHALNREFLSHDYATDVLAFPLDEEEFEVVVSADRAREEAASRGVEPLAELMLYVAHGILHLAGYDDHDPDDARRMHEATLKLLRPLGYRNTII